MEPIIYKPSIYNGAGIYNTGAGGGGGINIKDIAVLTDSGNGINFGTNEITSHIYRSGFHIYNSDYSIYAAPQHKQGFEFVCNIFNYSNSGYYGIFAAGSPTNYKGVSFQIEQGYMWIGIPGDNNTWIGNALVDIRNIFEPNKFFKLYGMYDLDTGLLEFSIDDVNLLSTTVYSNKNNFGPSSYFNVFCNAADTPERDIYGSIKLETIKIINDNNVFK